MRCVLALALLVAVASAGVTHTSKPVTGLPCDEATSETSYAGYITVDPEMGAELFYWFFESRNDPANDPVVLWMTGGPGCSSELAILFENGPYRVQDGCLIENEWSWNNNASVLYIDQPFGTGFSPESLDIVTTETIMATYVYAMLEGFFGIYPQFASNDFFVTGESYAGHYIPALSNKIVSENSGNPSIYINFKGAAIGNGWVNPLIQYGAYPTFGKENALLTELEYIAIEANYEACKIAIGAAETPLDWLAAEEVCEVILEEVLAAAPKINGSQINTYNIHEPCVVPGLCYNFTEMTNYMNNPLTQQALGVNRTWETCSTLAGFPLIIDEVHAFEDDLVPVLAAGVPVLVYSGNYDLICNYVGGEAWTNAMVWPGQNEFNNAAFGDWEVNGALAGSAKHAQNLTMLVVDAAGHMVPHDQPEAAFAMLTTFLAGKPFP